MTEPAPEPSTPGRSPDPAGPGPQSEAVVPRTRAGTVWVATGTAVVLLLLLIVFIAQNTQPVDVHYFSFAGSLSLGLALLVSAVFGAALVAIAGTARVLQLRMLARRNRDLEPRR